MWISQKNNKKSDSNFTITRVTIEPIRMKYINCKMTDTARCLYIIRVDNAEN